MDDLGNRVAEALNAAGPARRDRVFAVADAWYRAKGIIPTITVTRQYIGSGSNTDIANDLKEFARILSERHKARLDIPNLPEALVERLEGFGAEIWDLMYRKAKNEFLADREALQRRAETAEASASELRVERDSAIAVVEDLRRRLGELDALLQQQREATAQVAAQAEQLTGRLTEAGKQILATEALVTKEREDRALDRRRYMEDVDAARRVEREKDARLQDMVTVVEDLKARLAASQTMEGSLRQRATRAETDLAAEKMARQLLESQLARDTAMLKDMKAAKVRGARPAWRSRLSAARQENR